MKKGKIITEDADLKEILTNSKNIAVLGLSSNSSKTSYQVANYLVDNGYDITPVRPGVDNIMGKKVVHELSMLESSPDILNVFRKSEDIPGHVEDALKVKPKVFWMQLGIKNEEAANKLIENGIDVVMDRCIKIDHKRLCS